jgi:hypothetical protein
MSGLVCPTRKINYLCPSGPIANRHGALFATAPRTPSRFASDRTRGAEPRLILKRIRYRALRQIRLKHLMHR